MAGTFHVAIDSSRRMVTMEVTGFLSLTDVEAAVSARSDGLRLLGPDKRPHVVLVDVRNCEIQAQDVAAGFTHMIEHRPMSARRVAFVTGDRSLAKLQAKRLTASLNEVRIFDDMRSAEAWLMREDDDAEGA